MRRNEGPSEDHPGKKVNRPQVRKSTCSKQKVSVIRMHWKWYKMRLEQWGVGIQNLKAKLEVPALRATEVK